VPCAIVVAGKLTVEMPAEAGVFLLGAPVSRHGKEDGGHHILAGGAGHIGDHMGHGFRNHKPAVDNGGAGHCGAFDFLFGSIPGGEQLLRGQSAESGKICTAGLFHNGFPEGKVAFRRAGFHQRADTAAAGHDSTTEESFTERAEAVLLDAHCTVVLR